MKVVADHSKDAEGNPVVEWIEITHEAATAHHAYGLSVEEVFKIIVCWEELEVISMNPDNTMVKFGIPLFISDCLLSA